MRGRHPAGASRPGSPSTTSRSPGSRCRRPWCALAEIKGAAAAVHRARGLIDADLAEAIERAAAAVTDGRWDDQFPVDVFQTGSGTSTNMNVNEVVANLASEALGRPVHPNDDVNRSQSSNDAVPAATRLAAAGLVTNQLAPALDRLAHSLRALSAAHTGTVKMGRTHLMDAVPMTFGQEVGGWARSVELGRDRITSCLDRLLELPLGGTAVGTGLNAPPGFDADIATELARRTGLATRPAADHMEAQSRTDSLTELSAMVKVVSLSLYAIAGDLRLLGSGPVGGLAEIRLPSLQAGSSIMPGKVNPVIPEAVQQVAAQIVGNDATVTFAATMSNLQLNTAAPVIARALVSSLQLLANAARLLADRCITGIAVDADRMLDVARRSPALVTVLAPSLGYDAAAALVSRAREDGRPLAELARDAGVPEHVTARLDDLAGMTRPSPDVSRSTGSGTGAP
ncbi:MAG: lyase family protein [Ilumatobacteraceae bacterium]